MQINATIWAIKTDREGESTIVLKSDASNLEKVLSLAILTEKLLKIDVSPAEEQSEVFNV